MMVMHMGLFAVSCAYMPGNVYMYTTSIPDRDNTPEGQHVYHMPSFRIYACIYDGNPEHQVEEL